MHTIENLRMMGPHIFSELIFSEKNFYEEKKVYILLQDGLLIGDFICDFDPEDGFSSWDVRNLNPENFEKLQALIEKDFSYPDVVTYLKECVYNGDSDYYDFWNYVKEHDISYEFKYYG